MGALLLPFFIMEEIKSISKNIEEVRTILRDFKETVTEKNNRMNFDLKRGNVEGKHHYFNDFDLFIIEADAGSEIDWHVHKNSIEVIYNLYGKCIYKFEDYEKEMKESNSIRIEKNQVHKTYYFENTKQIILAIPPLEVIDVGTNE